MYVQNLLHKEQLHVSALDIGHLQVEKWKKNLVSSHTQLMWFAYSGEVKGEVGTVYNPHKSSIAAY